MREDVLDLLMYIFEHRLDDDVEEDPGPNEVRLRLQEAGFPHSEIERALDWLDRLVSTEMLTVDRGSDAAHRIFTPEEERRIGLEARGFLLFLEQNAMLTPGMRELVIDRVMELDANEIDAEQLRWVVLMVLFNQPDDGIAYSRLEDFVLGETRAPSGALLH
jgi:Smg protein